jgi:hypothetical protein
MNVGFSSSEHGCADTTTIIGILGVCGHAAAEIYKQNLRESNPRVAFMEMNLLVIAKDAAWFGIFKDII